MMKQKEVPPTLWTSAGASMTLSKERCHSYRKTPTTSPRKRKLAAITRDLHLALKREAMDAITIGQLKAKEQVKHGDWYRWLDKNFSTSKPSASRYMRLYEAARARHHHNRDAATFSIRVGRFCQLARRRQKRQHSSADV
jgi:hypothetical protein